MIISRTEAWCNPCRPHNGVDPNATGGSGGAAPGCPAPRSLLAVPQRRHYLWTRQIWGQFKTPNCTTPLNSPANATGWALAIHAKLSMTRSEATIKIRGPILNF